MKKNDCEFQNGSITNFAIGEVGLGPPTGKIFDRWLLFLDRTFDLWVAIPYLMTLFFRGLLRGHLQGACSTGPMTQYWLAAYYTHWAKRRFLGLKVEFNFKMAKELIIIFIFNLNASLDIFWSQLNFMHKKWVLAQCVKLVQCNFARVLLILAWML